MGAVLMIAAMAALTVWLHRAARRLDTQAARIAARVRHPSVAGRRVVNAALAAQSQADHGCVLCDEMPCEAGPHFRWVGSWDDVRDDA